MCSSISLDSSEHESHITRFTSKEGNSNGTDLVLCFVPATCSLHGYSAVGSVTRPKAGRTEVISLAPSWDRCRGQPLCRASRKAVPWEREGAKALRKLEAEPELPWQGLACAPLASRPCQVQVVRQKRHWRHQTLHLASWFCLLQTVESLVNY